MWGRSLTRSYRRVAGWPRDYEHSASVHLSISETPSLTASSDGFPRRRESVHPKATACLAWPSVRGGGHRHFFECYLGCRGESSAAGSSIAGNAVTRNREALANCRRDQILREPGPPRARGTLLQVPQRGKAKRDMRLDSLGAMLTGGKSGPAIVPGKPAESNLIQAINYASEEMPPDGKLPAEQIAALTRWVAIGAPWPRGDSGDSAPAGPVRRHAKGISDEDRAHWSYQPVKKPATPVIDTQGWAKNPIDAFVAARLSAAGLAHAASADRATLIRRVSFDLVGLPPSPEEVANFVGDSSPNAYERLVDRLLESPRYGEHWARHWLDLARYAESDGFQGGRLSR